MASTSIQLNSMMDALKKTQPFFQIGFAVLSIGAFLSLFQATFGVLSMTGGQMVSFELWRLITSFIVERNPILLLWSLWCLRMASLIIEPVWGDIELLRYFAIVQVLSSLLIALISLLSYIIVKDYSFFYHAEVSGASALCAALYVAIKQFLPDSILLTTAIGRLKNNHLPGCALLGVCVLTVCGAVRPLVVLQFLPDSILLTTAIGRLKNNHLPGCALLGVCVLTVCGAVRPLVVLQVMLGVQLGWTYLRFYQAHEDGEPKGDSSDHFAWATLFPSKLQPFMAVISGMVFSVLIRLRMCKPIVRHVDVARLDSVNIILPGLQTRDTERRRQKALRDLTERLSRAQRVETGSWPDMEDIEEDTQVSDMSSSAVPEPTTSSSAEQVPIHVTSEQEQTEGEAQESPSTASA
ncbi:Transmembrane protein [Toxocara canis]|uniref:Transmembrane protein n=1 Tax=Toxocara canis TaxID=6265 RepID=A0A0B2VJP2_TOXCA|nr:Transmembrane protein [Toxocara canis]